MADEEKKELTEEERAEVARQWETYVRSEVNALLDIFLPNSVNGNVGIKYANPVRAKYETHTEYDTDKAIGVNINIVFMFDREVNLPKE
jgi:hypothetical protein